jgi:Ca2+-binding RTX toxin-like protein
LLGQDGADVLTGGTGDDLFRYTLASHGGDTITDFGAATGNNDRFSIDASGFGGGLAGGSLSASQFVLRTTNSNAATDSNDRFIFNSVTNTLWFDVDGTGATGPVLIATLQANAADLTVDDIWLFA